MYEPAELSALFELGAERGWWMIADEIYVRIAYNGDAPRTLHVAPNRERVVVVDGVAKAYAMTGWRIGWTITVQAARTVDVGVPVAHYVERGDGLAARRARGAREHGQRPTGPSRRWSRSFVARRDAGLAHLRRIRPFAWSVPTGAFYLFIEAPNAASDTNAGTAFASYLLEKHDVAVVPGAAFLTPGWVRVSYAAAQ